MKTITIKDFLDLIKYRIYEGSNYQWECFGKNAFCFDYWDQENDISGGMIFDTETHVVYYVTFTNEKTDVSYRWVHPEWRDIYAQEVINKGVSDMAWDDIPFIDIDDAEEMLEKSACLINQTK